MFGRLHMIRSQIITRLPYFLHSGCKWSSKIGIIGHFGERQRVVASADCLLFEVIGSRPLCLRLHTA